MTEGVQTVRLRYTESMLRRAVRVFVWRSVMRRWWLWLLAVGLLAFSAAADLADGPSFVGGVAVAGLFFLAVFVFAIWRAHFRNTVGRFRKLDPPEAEFTFGPDALGVRSAQGTSTVPWSRFVQVWTLPDCWLLFLAPSQFMTLPTAGLSPETLAMLRAKLPLPS